MSKHSCGDIVQGRIKLEAMVGRAVPYPPPNANRRAPIGRGRREGDCRAAFAAIFASLMQPRDIVLVLVFVIVIKKHPIEDENNFIFSWRKRAGSLDRSKAGNLSFPPSPLQISSQQLSRKQSYAADSH